MLYYKFKNYQEFQKIFTRHNSETGTKSRRNKILLTLLKSPKLLQDARLTGDYSLVHITSMSELKEQLMLRITASSQSDPALKYEVNLLGKKFHSAKYETDENCGICEDGDYRAIRYINHDSSSRTYKMKAGKIFRALALETEFGRSLPESVLGYIQEEFVQDWQGYAMAQLPKHQLIVNDDFARIYDKESCEGSFNSCMADRDLHIFYEDSVQAQAAMLEDEDGAIIARCIIFNEVMDDQGKIYRLAERQYSTDGSEILQRTLINSLINQGLIDGYKKVGAGCADSKEFVSTLGESLAHKRFSIECRLDYGDPLSYQDSFKWFDYDNNRAYNYPYSDYAIMLDTTEGYIEQEDDQVYDSYHDDYCDEVVTVYVRGEEMTCDSDRLQDFTQIDGELHHDDDVSYCPHCNVKYLTSDGVYYEDRDLDYCSLECLESDNQPQEEE